MNRKIIALMLATLFTATILIGCSMGDEPDKTDDLPTEDNDLGTDAEGQDDQEGEDTSQEDTSKDDEKTDDMGTEPLSPELGGANDINIDHLVSLIGMKESDLDALFLNVSSAEGDSSDTMRKYQVDMLGKQSEISVSLEADGTIKQINLVTEKEMYQNWVDDVSDRYGDMQDGESVWYKDGTQITVNENQEHVTVIIAEKPAETQ